jgi:hypothetical protein
MPFKCLIDKHKGLIKNSLRPVQNKKIAQQYFKRNIKFEVNIDSYNL